MRRATLAWLLAAAACGGEAGGPPPQAPPSPGEGAASPPDVELRDPGAALVHGQAIAFDGLAEGLAWPALDKAMGPRAPGRVVSMQVARTEPTVDVLRAAWTLRAADVRVQTLDSGGELRVVELRPKRDDAPAAAGCHVAVFVRPDGSLRVAAPGGPRAIDAERAADVL